MGGRRVLGIFLDGYETSLEDELRAAGELPHLAALRSRGAVATLVHGPAQRTGLAGEHLSTGLDPDAAGRFAAVDFDPTTYVARQVGTRAATFVELLDADTVVFDVPYFDLDRTEHCRGVVNWGAHDPGVPPSSRPAPLLDELCGRVGSYHAPEYLYRTPWASVEDCERMGRDLAAAADQRSTASLWLLGERLPDWELAVVAVSEAHSAIEGLWHGIDPDHPLAGHPSAAAAGDGVRAVYRAIDRLVGAHVEAFPDATVVVFSMHGMGTNRSDVASMALLPELLHRRATGTARLRVPGAWSSQPDSPPPMPAGASWSSTVRPLIASGTDPLPALRRVARRTLRPVLRRVRSIPDVTPDQLDWMPATRYADAWRSMDAFALPSFYDGRVRVNLAGREAEGMVDPARYSDVLDEVEQLVRDCIDPATGASAVDFVERPAIDRGVDPLGLGPSDADLVIVWRGPLALEHRELGLVGPLPFRRTGGHSAPHGVAVVAGDGIRAGDLGTASAFDVVPTLIDLLGRREALSQVSGRPLELADAG